MRRQQNQTPNKPRGGRGGGGAGRRGGEGRGEELELDPSMAAKRQWKQRDGKSLICDSEGSQSLAAGDVFNKNVLKPVSLSPRTFTQSRQRWGPSLVFLLSGDGTHPASGQLLPPEAELPVSLPQGGPRAEVSPSISKITAAAAGDALTAEAGMSVNTFVTVVAGNTRLWPVTACSPCRGLTFQTAVGATLQGQRHDMVHL